MGRILTTLLLLQTGYAYVPYSSLESVTENRGDGYYLAFRQTQRTIRSEPPEAALVHFSAGHAAAETPLGREGGERKKGDC